MEVQHITEAYCCSSLLFFWGGGRHIFICLSDHGVIVIDHPLILVTFLVGQYVILVIHILCWLYFVLLAMPQEINIIFKTFLMSLDCCISHNVYHCNRQPMLQLLLPEIIGGISVIRLHLVMSMDLHSHAIRITCLGIVCSWTFRAGDVFK